MINLPEELTASRMLCCEGLTPFIDKLLKGSRSLRAEGDWLEGELCVLEAMEASRESSPRINRGATLVYLGDIRREMGRLGPALTHYREAHRIFQYQSSHRQRHNEAVAAYGLGLMHHLLGGNLQALKWYQSSRELLTEAKKFWTDENALARIDVCIRAERWLGALSEFLTATVTRREPQFSSRIWVPIVPLENRGEIVEQLAIKRQGEELTPDLKVFRVHPLDKDWRLQLSPAVSYDAQEIPRRARWALAAEGKDHALVQWDDSLDQADLDKAGELTQSDVGTFVRDSGGKVLVIRRGPRVIGGEDRSDEYRIGYIPAVLKPK